MTSAAVRLGQLPQPLLSLLYRWGCGCGPTQLLVDKLQHAQSVLAKKNVDAAGNWVGGYPYTFTIITDHGNYELAQVGTTILNVDREFLTLQVSMDAYSEKWEIVYVRLCTIRAIQEHYDRS